MRAKEVRAKFPAPVACRKMKVDPDGRPTLGQYCVGGAFLQFSNDSRTFPYTTYTEASFPGHHKVAHMLRLINPKLDFDKAQYFADRLIADNDLGLFEDAWRELDEALCYPDAPVTEEIIELELEEITA